MNIEEINKMLKDENLSPEMKKQLEKKKEILNTNKDVLK